MYSGDDHAMATTGIIGLEIRFKSEFMDVLPDDAVRRVIAHELAHVYQWAQGRMEAMGMAARDDIELDADEIADGWDIPSDGLDQWYEQQWQASRRKAGAA